jgi:glycosyltransferase involved in cell wall biosynthesis
MRILMVSEDLPAPSMGGLARHVLALCRALSDAGHRVDLMGNDDFPAEVVREAMLFGGQFFPELRGQFSGWKEMSLGVFMPVKRSLLARRFARAMQRRASDYDVIHYHGHLPNVAYYLSPATNFLQTRHDQGSDCLIHTRFRRGEVCNDIQPQACAGCRSHHPNPLQKYISALAVRRFRYEVKAGFLRHKTVFVSDMLRKNLSRCFGDQNWGITIHNFVDTSHLRNLSTHEQITLPTERLRVFIAAKLYPAKGVSALLAILEPHLGHRIVMDIAGDGEEEAMLRKRYANVNFHGWQSMEATLKIAMRAQVIVVPSVCEEACSTTVLEGLLLGKTVFALRRGGTPELSIYASRPDQLRLHEHLEDLANALLNHIPRADCVVSPQAPADASHAAGRLLALYSLPPGPIANQTMSTLDPWQGSSTKTVHPVSQLGASGVTKRTTNLPSS